MTEPKPYAAPPYRRIAWCYDAVSSAYSLGAIDRAKAYHHRLIEPGMRVLYAGAGRGREIVGACAHGACVTCVEPCPAMALALHDRLGESCDGFAVIPRPIQALTPDASFDLVVAHFFLNVFSPADMPGVLRHLCGFVGPGGSLVIADFKPAAAGASTLDRMARQMYYGPPHRVGAWMGICQPHPIYDYAPLLIDIGQAVESRNGFRVVPGLPALYEVVVARR